MKQYEAVIKVMEDNGGFATFQYLNNKALKVPGVEWKTLTPFASIRRIVQDSRYFFKIKPGLWALKSYKDKLPENISAIIEEAKLPPEKEKKYTHYHYQGVLADIGKARNYSVYIPPQDRNKPYLNDKLKDVSDREEIPSFTYPNIVNAIKSIDVIWINERGFPDAVFEIENSTDYKNSLTKFHELRDFQTKMQMVADEVRRRQFTSVMSMSIYNELKSRVKFTSYDALDQHYENPFKVKLEF